MNYLKIPLIFLLMTLWTNAFAQNNDDSLKHVLATTKDAKQKVDALTKLADDYSQSNTDSSLYYSNALRALAVKINDRKVEGYAMGNIAYCDMNLGNLVQALRLTFASLAIFESLKDSVDIANDYNGIGHIYRAQKDSKNAYKYYRMERALAVKIKDYRDDAYGSVNLGLLFLQDHNLDSAMYYTQRCLELHDKYHIDYPRAIALQLIADVYYAKGNYNKAMGMYRYAIAIAVKTHIPDIYTIQLKYAGQLYKLHEVDSALIYANKVLVHKKDIILVSQSTLYKLLSSIYNDKGNYKNAYKFQSQAVAINDSLSNTQQTQQTANLFFNEQQHQIDLKNAAIAYQEKLNTRLRMYVVIGVAAILLIIGIILWRNNRRQKQTNHLLSEQKEEISSQRDQLSETLAELNKRKPSSSNPKRWPRLVNLPQASPTRFKIR
jgi:tetratricopeptide (TPR) repeat protein